MKYLNAYLFELQQGVGRWLDGIGGFFGTKQFLLVFEIAIGLTVAVMIIFWIRNAIDKHFSRFNDELDRNE